MSVRTVDQLCGPRFWSYDKTDRTPTYIGFGIGLKAVVLNVN